MPSEELKNELSGLLDDAESVKSLDAMARGELKDRLLSLPDKGMRQVIEQLKDEREKLAAVGKEITAMNTEAKNEARTLHALMAREQREGEAIESNEQSESILKDLHKEAPEKKGVMKRMALLIALLAAAATAVVLLKYFNYF
jgi:uncharacterized membrane protein YgaE (UPF0421/DUF939 family)